MRVLGCRKIVLATNIAETSITIDDVVYVIDCGKAKETSYDALNKLACLLPSWVSKASAHQVISIQIELLYLCSFVSCIGFCDCHNLAFSANLLLSTSHGLNHQVSLWLRNCSSLLQRRGRAGRVQAGVCYHLYPKLIYSSMPLYQLPEILRTPLQELCLQIKSLQLGSIAYFLSKALEPPEALAVQNAIELLKTIGALDITEELTPLGKALEP